MAPVPEGLPPVDADRGWALLRLMVRLRRFEERCVERYSAQEIRGFVHLGIGQEAVVAGIVPLLEVDDAIVATYREHDHALARGISMASVMAELYGRVEGTSHGRGGSMHLFDAARRFYGGHAIVAGGLPVAAGLALADHLQGRPRVTACFFGEGAMAEGEFHEAVNLAALWQLPVLFCCENNRYAMGTALARSQAQVDLVAKAAAYGLDASSVDGMDVTAVADAARAAIDAVRAGGGPRFVELQTYRFRAHSLYDPERYRTHEEVAAWRRRDPIELLAARLGPDAAPGGAAREQLEVEVAAEVDAAVEAARAGTLEPVATLTRFTSSEAPS